MFNRFKKRIVPKTLQIPSARKTYKVSKQAWDTIPLEEIMERIEYHSLHGQRSVYFYSSLISPKNHILLRLKGYSVEVSVFNDRPYFKVSW